MGGRSRQTVDKSGTLQNNVRLQSNLCLASILFLLSPYVHRLTHTCSATHALPYKHIAAHAYTVTIQASWKGPCSSSRKRSTMRGTSSTTSTTLAVRFVTHLLILATRVCPTFLCGAQLLTSPKPGRVRARPSGRPAQLLWDTPPERELFLEIKAFR